MQSLLGHLDYDEDNFATVLISLSQVAKLQPQIFATKYKTVVKEFVVKKLMFVDRVSQEWSLQCLR